MKILRDRRFFLSQPHIFSFQRTTYRNNVPYKRAFWIPQPSFISHLFLGYALHKIEEGVFCRKMINFRFCSFIKLYFVKLINLIQRLQKGFPLLLLLAPFNMLI
ncbi:hypothetical protein ABB05_04920 [Lederbergia galactosidilytica]|uniref:Uncharacterized protein n=1 Tax=Lederbergia galactosidilytica TaxID=217031 RepID=A0A178A290_9BACI|nr:hypothetical protein ABB05_04920 [Lederbergia galactosidilytica]